MMSISPFYFTEQWHREHPRLHVAEELAGVFTMFSKTCLAKLKGAFFLAINFTVTDFAAENLLLFFPIGKWNPISIFFYSEKD